MDEKDFKVYIKKFKRKYVMPNREIIENAIIHGVKYYIFKFIISRKLGE